MYHNENDWVKPIDDEIWCIVIVVIFVRFARKHRGVFFLCSVFTFHKKTLTIGTNL